MSWSDYAREMNIINDTTSETDIKNKYGEKFIGILDAAEKCSSQARAAIEAMKAQKKEDEE